MPDRMRILSDSGCVRSVVFATESAFRWIDVVAPDRPTLSALTEELGLPDSAVEDCLDHRALPKHERYSGGAMTVLRAHVDPIPESAAGTFELTHAITLFAGDSYVLSVHRWDHRAIARLRREYETVGPTLDEPAVAVLEALISQTLATYHSPLDRLTTELETVEASLLGPRLTETALEQVFVRKRRAGALALLLLRMREALLRMQMSAGTGAPVIQALREDAETLHFRARELVEYSENLMNLQIGIASHRTNEVMRILTLMSVVFMPLTFIVGIYGMNFNAPEFKWRFGYPMVWVLLIGVTIAVIRWFQRRGWLR